MPAELALLPVVESAFDPFAYSHGRAAGLVADHSRAPASGSGSRRTGGSTAAATCSSRRAPRSTTSSSCTSSSTAIGCSRSPATTRGEGNVARALKKAAAAGKPQDFWGIKSYLPAETRTYVPRLLAIARARRATRQPSASRCPSSRNEPQFAVVETGGQIDMALAAELAGIETDALYALNAGVNRWATDPDGPHRLLLPIDARGRCSRRRSRRSASASACNGRGTASAPARRSAASPNAIKRRPRCCARSTSFAATRSAPATT